MSAAHQPPRPTETAHLILRGFLKEGDTVVDATAGNGHDTAFLAKHVGPRGRVHAFDIQANAIESARQRVADAGLNDRVTFHLADHATMGESLATSSVSAVVFNLGYLPGADHSTTTSRVSTLPALHAAAQLLRSGGLLSVLCYPGHPEGAAESVAISAMWPTWASNGWRIATYSLPFTASASPVLWIAAKP